MIALHADVMSDLCLPEVVLVLALPARSITWVLPPQPKRLAVSIQEDRRQACYPAAIVFARTLFAKKFRHVAHLILVFYANTHNSRLDWYLSLRQF